MSRRKTTTASSAPAADMARFRSTDENQHPLVSIEFEGLPSEVFAHAGDLHSRGHSIDVRGIRGWSELPEFAFTSYERFEQAVLIRSSKQPGAPVAPSSRFRRYTLDDLKRREPPKWIIDQAIAESNGGTIIYGAPGTFKTFIALDMALCIATDTAWHGRSVKHSVLAPYYDIPSEKWRTPPVLPGIPSGYEIPTDDDAPDGKVAPIQRRRKRAA